MHIQHLCDEACRQQEAHDEEQGHAGRRPQARHARGGDHPHAHADAGERGRRGRVPEERNAGHVAQDQRQALGGQAVRGGGGFGI